MALNINNTTPGPLLDPFKLVKITKDNISDYPGLDAKFIGYNLFVNQTRDIADEYKRVLGGDLVDSTTRLPSPAKIYEQVEKDIGRSKMSINDVQLQNAFESNKAKYDALETSATLDEFRENLAKIFPGTSILDDQPQLEAIYNDALFKKLIPFIYSIYNRFGIKDNDKILEYMAFLQQGSAGSITNLFFQMYSIEPNDDQYVGRLNTSNNPPEPEKINLGDFSGESLDGAMNVSETIKENAMNGIQINAQLFTSYANVAGDAYIFFATNTITYIAYPANKVYLLMDIIWRNESVHKAYDLIKQIDTNSEINQRIMWYMYESIFKEYKSPQIQSILVNIFDLLLKIADLEKRAEIFGKLKSIMNKILVSNSIYISGKLQYLYSALFDAKSIDTILNAESIAQIESKLKEFDTCDDDIDSSCKANEKLLPNEPTFFNKITQRVTQRASDVYRGRITPLDKDQAVKAGNSAIMWARKAYEWSKSNSIAGAQSALEQIEAIKSKLDASAKQYKEDMDRDTSLYKKYNPIYEQIVAISKKADIALNFATSVVIIDTLRQAPEGIGSGVNVVKSLVTSTLKKIQSVSDDDADAVDDDVDADDDVIDVVDDDVDGGVEEEKDSVADDQAEEAVPDDGSATDNGVEEEKDAEADVVDVGPPPQQIIPGLDPMCNNKQKWEEYYKAARPVVNHPIEPDNAWQTEEQSAALCGQHALHNMFRKVWTETACPPKNIRKGVIQNDIYKEHLAADEAKPITTFKQYNDELKGLLENYNITNEIDLYKICRINRRFILVNDNGTILFRVDPDGCENTGNYSPVIIRNALNIVGYPTFEINNVGDKKYTTEEYCKFIIDQFQSGNNLIGMILHTLKADKNPKNGHFIEVRKNNDVEIEVIDTLYKSNPGSQAESAKLTLVINRDKDALATELNAWIGQAVYKEIYGLIGVFPFSGKYVPARLDQYSDLGELYRTYEETTGHDERYTDEAGDIFQKREILFPLDEPTPKTDLIDTCKDAGAENRDFSVETTEIKYVPIYMEDVGVKGGGGRSKKQRGGANAESSVKDLYDIAMMLLNLNGELIEKSESQPSEESEQSNLTNTLTILLNTRIPGKRHVLYKPQMTIPNINSSQVWFDPRIKLKKSIVNKAQSLPPPVQQPQTNVQDIYQMPSGYQQYSNNNPYNYDPNRYQAPNQYSNDSYYNSQPQYGGADERETTNERKEIYTQFFNRNEFNNLLLRTMNESPQQIVDLTTAKEEGITDNNIQVTLDTLFKSDNVIYLDGMPYTIYAHDWIVGDWQIDTRPNIYINSSTRFQLQAPTYTSYGVIIPKKSNIAIFEEQAKKERSKIPIALQRGDALEMSSKINKAIKSVISHVAQNKKPRLTADDIMKKASPWELAKLLERQMANRAYEASLDETPNYVNVEPSSVAANARVDEVEKTKAAADARAKAVADAKAEAVAEADAKAMAIAQAKAEAETAENALKNVNNAAEEAKTMLATLKEAEGTTPPDDILAAEQKVEEMEKQVEDAKEEVDAKKAEFIDIVQGKLPKDLLMMMMENYIEDIKKVVERNPIEKLRHNFLSSLREAGIKSMWNITSIRNLFNLDKDNKIIDAKNSIKQQTINQINQWQMLTPPQKSGNTTAFYNLYQVIAIILKNRLNTQITANFIQTQLARAKISAETDQIIKYIEQTYNIKLVIIVVPDQNAVKPQNFELNQRVSFTITPIDIATNKALRVRARESPTADKTWTDFKSTMYGVIVKENPNNTYNILTDDYTIIENIPYKDINLSKKYMIYNPVEPLEEASPTNIRDLKLCAFLLYDQANNEDPYSVIYRSKGPGQDQYIFKLDDLPSYLYYMIFLASYRFDTPADNEPIGEFVVNSDSLYPKIKSLMTNTRVKGMYDIYTNILKSNPYYVKAQDESDIKSQMPTKQRIQFGGGPEDDLVRAIETNNMAQLKRELNQDASLINKTDANGNTMLMIACQNKNLGIVKTLLEMGAQGTINKQNAIGDTALHIACKNGYAAIASVLVLNGADLTIKNVLGKTPIEVCGDPALKAILELHLANVKKMFEFVKNNRTQDLRALMKTFRGVNLVDLTTGDTPLHIACQLGNKDIALLLIQAGANPTLKNKNDQTPFDLVENETLKTNLQDQYNLTLALFQAVQNNSLPEVKQILNALPPNQVSILVNSRTNPASAGEGETPLHIAVKNGNREIVKFLLDRGADVNAGDKYEATPLHFACRNGDGYIARMLVEFGGDLTITAIDGRTPLDACKTNELRIDLIRDYIEKLARDKKLNLPKGSGLSRSNDEESIKKALAYYLNKPNKIESKNSYYVVMDLDLYPGTSISTAQKARMQCSRVWDNIQEAWADSRGVDYVPREQNISKAPLPVATEVPLTEAKPIRREGTRRRYGGKKSGSTRRCAKKKCRGPKTRKHKRMKHKFNSRRVKK